MEKMTEKEIQLLRDLQAKQKRVKRAEEEFWSNVEERKSEVLERLNISVAAPADNTTDKVIERINEIAEKYGTDVDTLLEYISTDRQVSYYRSTHQS